MSIQYKDVFLGGLVLVTTTLLGVAAITSGTALYSFQNSVMNDIRAKQIDNDIAISFENSCRDEFYNEQRALWNRSSLYKEGSIVTTYKKWKKTRTTARETCDIDELILKYSPVDGEEGYNTLNIRKSRSPRRRNNTPKTGTGLNTQWRQVNVSKSRPMFMLAS